MPRDVIDPNATYMFKLTGRTTLRKEDFKIAPANEVGQVLLRAADLLEQRGWCKFVIENEAGQICTLRAICLAAGTDLVSPETGEAKLARDAVDRVERAEHVDDICSWNNSRHSLEQVTGTLRALACQ